MGRKCKKKEQVQTIFRKGVKDNMEHVMYLAFTCNYEYTVSKNLP
jgi:hypothetical protein